MSSRRARTSVPSSFVMGSRSVLPTLTRVGSPCAQPRPRPHLVPTPQPRVRRKWSAGPTDSERCEREAPPGATSHCARRHLLGTLLDRRAQKRRLSPSYPTFRDPQPVDEPHPEAGHGAPPLRGGGAPVCLSPPGGVGGPGARDPPPRHCSGE